MATIALTVNGRAHTLDVDPATPLLYVLSDDLALNGPKFGCGLGQCGACTVIVRGRAVRSCVTPVGTLDGADDHHARGARHARAAASDPAGLHRRAGRAVRLLPQRRDPHRQGLARSQPEGRAKRRSSRRCRRCCAAASRTPGCCGRSSGMPSALGADAGQEGDRVMRLAPRVPEERRRADRQLQQRARCASDIARRARARSPPRISAVARQLDSWLAIAARRPRHRLHRQVRARAGHLHRADAAGRRGAVRAARARHADSMRHGGRAGSGDHVGQPVDADQLQRGQPGAGLRDGAGGAAAVSAPNASACRRIS